MKTKNCEKSVPLKNYIILLVIIILSIIFVFYGTKLYNINKQYRQNNSVISSIILEVKENDLESYLIENPTITIYMASSKDENIKEFEDNFKKYIKDNQLSKSIVYLDTDKVINNNFYKKIIKNYSDNGKLNIQNKTTLMNIEDGRITAIISKKSDLFDLDDVKSVINGQDEL